MPASPETILAIAMDRLIKEADSDAELLALALSGGDFTSDAVDVPKADYEDFRAENWDDPVKRKEWASQVMPKKFLEDAFAIIAPDLAKEHRGRWMEMVEAGVPVHEANALVQRMHQAAQIVEQVKHPELVPPPAPVPLMPEPVALAPQEPMPLAPPPPPPQVAYPAPVAPVMPQMAEPTAFVPPSGVV